MTSVLEASAPVLPPNPGDIPTASRRGRGRLVAIWLVVGLLCTALIVVYIVTAVQNSKRAAKSVTEAVTETAAAEALLADDTATSHQLPLGALTLALLDQQRPHVTWSGGSDSVPISSNRTYVSVAAAGGHVVTAVNMGFCTYGLTVIANDDPIIGQDQLSGVGTYSALSTTMASAVASATSCSAESAPSSGWVPANRSAMERIIAPTSG